MHFLSCHLLTAQSPLLARILQFPIARSVDLLLTPGEHVLRRDVDTTSIDGVRRPACPDRP